MPSSDYQRYTSSGQRNGRMKRLILQILVSTLLIVPALCLCIFLRGFLIKKTLKAVELKPGSDGYKTWLNPPVKTVRSYYLYNISNPNEVITDPTSATLNLTESPAYTYNVETKKTNIKWSDDNEKVSYSVERLFTRHPTLFNPSSVNDTGVFVDMLRATFRTQFQAKPAQTFFDIGGMNTFYRRNAIDQLEGFTSELFHVMRDKMTGPNIDKSGFIYRHNGSRLYNVTIKTDVTHKGHVLQFDSESVPLSVSSSDYAFPIYDGLTFAPMLFDKPSLNIFQADFCKPIRIKFVKVVRMYGGMSMHQYAIKLIDFNSCENSNDENTCPEVEQLDVSKCISASLPDKTVFFSKAHFYGISDEKMQEMNINGLSPKEDKHDSFIYFEPYSGTPFKAIYRMQLNVHAVVDPMKVSNENSEPEQTNRRGVRRVLPVLWLDQEVTIDKSIIDRLRMIHIALNYGRWIILALSIGLSIGFIALTEYLARRADRNSRSNRGAYTKADSFISH